VRLKMKNVSNAYMLVYVRVSDWDSVMCEAGAAHLMEHVSTRLAAEQRDKERKRHEKLQAHRFVTLKVVTDAAISAHVRQAAFDLVRLDDLAAAHTLKVPKTDTWQQVAAQIEASTGVPASKQVYWRWQARNNGTCRPAELLTVSLEGSGREGWGAPAHSLARSAHAHLARRRWTPRRPSRCATAS